jgi:hypothetical protein
MTRNKLQPQDGVGQKWKNAAFAPTITAQDTVFLAQI